MKTSTETLIKALRILAKDIKSDDGVANAAISEAADRMEQLYNHNGDLREMYEKLAITAAQTADLNVAFRNTLVNIIGTLSEDSRMSQADCMEKAHDYAYNALYPKT